MVDKPKTTAERIILIVGLGLWACDDPGADLVGNPVGPSTGTLVVSTSTVGDDPDPDGYQLTVDNTESLELSPTGTAEIDLPSGRHTLRLLGVAGHCAVTPATPFELDVPSGSRTPVAFEVSCPLTGVRITVTTTGLDVDPDGYRVVADGRDRGAIPSNGTVMSKLDPGTRTISLAGLASNCAVDGPASHTVTIVAAEVETIDLVVVCAAVPPLTGSLWGQVFGEDSALCLQGAMVEIVAGPGMGRRSGQPATCDPWSYDGWFLNDLQLGATVTLRATAPGYQPKDSVVVVPAGGGPVQFVLQPNAGFEGSIAFDRSGEIYVAYMDGSNLRQLTFDGWDGAYDSDAAWSPDGSRIAFSKSDGQWGAEIYVTDADGTNPTRLSPKGAYDASPTWSPDGNRIAFENRRDNRSGGHIFVMNADGTNRVQLTTNRQPNSFPAWSPDGRRIAYVTYADNPGDSGWDIYLMNPDGTNRQRLTSDPGYDFHPEWSPDGSRIAFSGPGGSLFVINADGTNLTRLTPARSENEFGWLEWPAWSPDGLMIAFTRASDCYWDPYGDPICHIGIWVLPVSGGPMSELPLGRAFRPSWRP